MTFSTLHKPRLKAIMEEVNRRWPGKLKFTFPNGLRGDILDEEVINALSEAGTYLVCIAVETVTPRLQKLVEKNLDIEKTRNAIKLFGKHNIQVNGFFMLGFPTETPEEIKATIKFANLSKY
jgi:anaerobic magnesium-protoporphyrin IX monomethyl ester cyclase